jgi:hypothetical protein
MVVNEIAGLIFAPVMVIDLTWEQESQEKLSVKLCNSVVVITCHLSLIHHACFVCCKIVFHCMAMRLNLLVMDRKSIQVMFIDNKFYLPLMTQTPGMQSCLRKASVVIFPNPRFQT